MIILYWLIAAIYGIAGTLAYFEYTPIWFLVQLGGWLLISFTILAGKKRINDYLSPVGLCFIAWVFYANIYYLIHSYLNYDAGFTFEIRTVNLGFFLSFTSVCIFGIISEISLCYRKPIISPVIKLDQYLRNNQPFPFPVVFSVGLLVAGYVANLFLSGAFAMIGKVDRLTLGNALESGKVWLVNYMLTGATLYYFYAIGASRLRKISNRRLLGIILILFWGCYLLMGNRRGLLTILLAGCIVLVWQNKVKLRHFVIGFLVLLSLLGIGVVRQLSGASFDSVDLTIHVINGIGEFYFPQITLLQTINNGSSQLFGSTFVSWFTGFIGAKIQGDTFQFLAQQFAHDVAPIGAQDYIGYAYMPLTEAYINFGIAGAIIAPTIIVGIIRLVEEFFGKQSLPVLVIGAMALDINRGEFGAIVMQYMFIIVSGLVLFFLAYLTGIIYNKVIPDGEPGGR